MMIFADQECLQAFFKVCRSFYVAKSRQTKAKYISMVIKYLPGSANWDIKQRNQIERCSR